MQMCKIPNWTSIFLISFSLFLQLIPAMWLKQRSEVDGSSWHTPSTWQEMEKLLEGYEGCWDYDVGEVPRLVVDTTAAKGVEEMVSSVLEFLYACGDHKSVNFN